MSTLTVVKLATGDLAEAFALVLDLAVDARADYREAQGRTLADPAWGCESDHAAEAGRYHGLVAALSAMLSADTLDAQLVIDAAADGETVEVEW